MERLYPRYRMELWIIMKGSENMAYIDVTPIIENTTMKIYENSKGQQLTYNIAPIDGYVLHDSRKDWTDIDQETNEEILFGGFSTYGVSVPITYDFTTNPFNLYTKLASEVPADQIFGGGNR